MLNFKKITYKNILATGNHPISIQLDKCDRTLIHGKNGRGKCVRKNTIIEVKYNDIDMVASVGSMAELYEKHPEYVGEFYVKTRFGYYPILAATITAYDSEVYRVFTDDKRELFCSPEHRLLLDDGSWIHAKDIRIGDKIQTIDGSQRVDVCEKIEGREDLYDIQVAEKQEYYSNGIVSHNSTIISALSYGLYGKDFRGITKDKLINSINKKNVEIIIELEKNGSEYVITRGIKPDTFIVTKDSEQVLAEGGSRRALQEYVEEHVLGFGFETFKQIVVIASGKFQPFMLLSAPERRRVVESILSLDVFSSMTNILKNELDDVNAEITEIDKQYSITETKLDSQKNVIKKLESYNAEAIENKKKQIKVIRDELHKAKIDRQQKDDTLQKTTKDIVDISKHQSAINKLNQMIANDTANVRNNQKDINFLKGNDTCPTCKSDIDKAFKEDRLKSLDENVKTALTTIKTNKEKFDKINEFIDRVNEISKRVNNIQYDIRVIDMEISNNEQKIRSLLSEIEKLEENSNSDTTNIKNEIEELEKKLKDIRNSKDELYRKKNVIQLARTLVRDDAIKAEVIDQYIPMFNDYMNMMLEKLDFYVEFNLDSNFNETIKSRYRDNFTYANFSEGEKMRIDLAILFAWREIAKHRNNIHTNLLILDEIGDSSLDVEGVDNMMKIFGELDSNIFIISHSESLKDSFVNTIEFVKENNFSVMKENRC